MGLVGQRLRPAHRRERQGRIKMREEIAAPGRFPFQVRAQGVTIDRDEDQIGLSGEMFCRRFGELCRC